MGSVRCIHPWFDGHDTYRAGEKYEVTTPVPASCFKALDDAAAALLVHASNDPQPAEAATSDLKAENGKLLAEVERLNGQAGEFSALQAKHDDLVAKQSALEAELAKATEAGQAVTKEFVEYLAERGEALGVKIDKRRALADILAQIKEKEAAAVGQASN